MISIGTTGEKWLCSVGVTERAGKNRLHKEKPTHKRARPCPDAAVRTFDSIVFEVASALEIFSYMWHYISFL